METNIYGTRLTCRENNSRLFNIYGAILQAIEIPAVSRIFHIQQNNDKNIL